MFDFFNKKKKKKKSNALLGGTAYKEAQQKDQGEKGSPKTYSKTLKKKRRVIALAYVGALTGAGLASGQELLQYFVSFGYSGLFAICLVGLLHWVFGGITVALGSYFMARNQNQVLNKIGPAIVTKILDYGLMLDCFVLGFVMIAGAGSNLNQQFGLSIWVGSLLCAVLVFVCSLFDFEKVSVVIGSFTPFIVAFISIAAIYVFFFGPVILRHHRLLLKASHRPFPIFGYLFSTISLCA